VVDENKVIAGHSPGSSNGADRFECKTNGKTIAIGFGGDIRDVLIKRKFK
jgi:hypothetical protein